MIHIAVRRILRLQCRLLLVAIVLGWILGGHWSVPISVLLGGLSVLLPCLAYAKIAYAKRHVPPAQLLRAHFKAEAIKFLLTILMFSAVLLLFEDLSIAGVFGGFIATTSGYWFGLLLDNRENNYGK